MLMITISSNLIGLYFSTSIESDRFFSFDSAYRMQHVRNFSYIFSPLREIEKRPTVALVLTPIFPSVWYLFKICRT